MKKPRSKDLGIFRVSKNPQIVKMKYIFKSFDFMPSSLGKVAKNFDF